MSKRKKINVFHLGKAAIDATLLADRFQYIWLPLDYDFMADPEERNIFPAGQFNEKFKRCVFLLEQEAVLFTRDFSLCQQLPAHQIIYDHPKLWVQHVQELLDLKGAIPLDFRNFSEVFDFINHQFGFRQQGFKISMDHLTIHEAHQHQIKKVGNAYCEVNGIFPEDYRQVISWKMTYVADIGEWLEFFPEINVISGEIDYIFKLYLIQENTTKVVAVREFSMAEIGSGKRLLFQSESQKVYFNLSLCVRGGQGHFQIGQVHFRKALRNGYMIPGGQRLKDEEKLDGEVLYYFNPGDMKPPMAVYFSGYRSAEGFEGNGMMGSMDCPYMLIADPRLEGGNFYLGSPDLEQKIVAVIQEKLRLLGFTSDQLILSGLSMGTFGALYYASDLSPNSIIIGKPLTSLGTIALNERIQRPSGFPTSLDMLLYNTDGMTDEKAKALNQRFWRKFLTGDYTKTTFAIAYMKQDDYDMQAFPMLFKEIKEKFPTARVLYKGLIGRHNDNSSEINRWFLKQYRNILTHTFGRNVKVFK